MDKELKPCVKCQHLKEEVQKAFIQLHDTDEYYGGMNILAKIIGMPTVNWNSLETKNILDILKSEK